MRDYAFGNRLAALRRECGYSQFQLGKLIGVSDASVSKWENGTAKPRLGTYKKLAAVLDVDVSVLMNPDDQLSSAGGHYMNTHSFWNAAEDRMYEYYGENPPLAIINRFKEESCQLRNSAVIVLFAAIALLRQIAEKNHSLINLRGNTNGSLTAWLLGATVINPLPAHTYCPKCHQLIFHPEAAYGWDLPEGTCECGSPLLKDGHNLPFGTYLNGSAKLFSDIDCNVSPALADDAWKTILSFVQEYYTCDRYVYRQGEESRCPGEFTRLYLHPRKEGTAYQKIEDVPEVSRTTMLRYFKDVPSIMLFEDSTKNKFYPKKPDLKELLTLEVIRIAKEKYCDPYYRTSDDTFFGYLQSKAAVTLSMNGYDPVQLAESYGLKSYTELPLTLEDVWNTIIQAPNGDAGMASDILLQMRLGRYARRLPPRDLEMMKRIGLPEWFPDYACKVRHLFPKAHCIDFAYTHLVEAWAECMM